LNASPKVAPGEGRLAPLADRPPYFSPPPIEMKFSLTDFLRNAACLSLLAFLLWLAKVDPVSAQSKSPSSPADVVMQLRLGISSEPRFTGDYLLQSARLHSPDDFPDDSLPAFKSPPLDVNGSYYDPSAFYEMQRLFQPSLRDEEVSPSRITRKFLLAWPLWKGSNGPRLMIRPESDLFGAFGKRWAVKRLKRMPPIEVPPGDLALDLHVHTCFSHDSFADPGQMILAAAHKGLSGIAITDHNTMDGVVAAQARLRRFIAEGRVPPAFSLIPGEEISSADGHIVGLFLTRSISPGKSARETVDAIHGQGGLAIAAHPELDGLGELAKTLPFDGVETENAAERMHFAVAKKAAKERRLAFYNGVDRPRIGSSDAHDPAVVGVCYTLLKSESDLASIKAALLEGRSDPVARLTDDEIRSGMRKGLPGEALTMRKALNLKTFDFDGWLSRVTGTKTAHLWLWPNPQLFWSKSF
jgi:predicted metal-dependent phosphoesterase TrpH